MWCAEGSHRAGLVGGFIAALLVSGPALADEPQLPPPPPGSSDCSGAGSSRGERIEAGGDCDGPPPGGGDRDEERAERVHHTVECTAELRNDPSAWFVAYDPDWEDVDVHQETGLLLSDREEGQVVARYRDCDGNDRGSPFWADPPEDGEEADFDGLLQARDRALASLDLTPPQPRLAPEGGTLAGMPAWLWLDQPWEPLQATDAIPGVTVSVYAEPQELIWSTPEGDRVCEGPGIPWTQAAWDDYRSASSSTRGHGNPACTFVFADASGDQPYPTTVTVSWAAGWSIDGGARMELPPVELTTEVPVVVGERRAVRTG